MRSILQPLLAALAAPSPTAGASRLRNALTTLLELLGIALIVVGVYLLVIPAGFIVAGLALLLLSWRAIR